MKKLAIAILILCCASFSFAQETAATAAPSAEEAEKEPGLFAFDLKLAPNTTGALEGKAELGILYTPWVYSSLGFSVTSFTAVYTENNGSTTSIESTKNLDIDVLRTRPEFLKWNFAGDDFYAALNARLILNIKWMNQEKYGYGDYPTFSVFYNKEDTLNLYPFVGGDTEIKLGPVLLTGYYLFSPMILYSFVEGEKYYSVSGAIDPTPYSFNDIGFETRFGGTLVIIPVPQIEIKYIFDYLRHIGYTRGSIGPTGNEYVFEGLEMKHTLTLSLNINGYQPIIGVSFTTYSFTPDYHFSIQPYNNARWGFLFGVTYK